MFFLVFKEDSRFAPKNLDINQDSIFGCALLDQNTRTDMEKPAYMHALHVGTVTKNLGNFKLKECFWCKNMFFLQIIRENENDCKEKGLSCKQCITFHAKLCSFGTQFFHALKKTWWLMMGINIFLGLGHFDIYKFEFTEYLRKNITQIIWDIT